MNNVMFWGMMVSIWEILVALLVLLVMAGVVAGAIVLVVWLTRRGAAGMPDKAPVQKPPPSTPAPARRQGRKFAFVEERGGKLRVRWWVCCVSMGVGVLATALVLELFLRIGGWRNEKVWIPAIVAGVGSVCAWLIYEFSQAREARATGRAASAPVPPLPGETVVPAACPRCGAALPAEAPQGLCPRCVLGVGLATQTEATGESGPHGTKVVQPPPEPAEIAKHFPQLEILECLGRGGMGVVYKARQPKLNRLVALKILAPEKGADPKFAERFLREAQALARLNHPNIVTVHDFGEAEGLYYLLMEYVDGMTLRQLLHGQKIAPEEALSIVPRICEALQFAHEQGVVHRDIKPENVLVDRQGRVKIADFGIAKIVAADQPRQAITQDQVIGTPHYMAPEQVERPQLVDHRADIYSLGVVFYEMLTGELPLGKFQPPSKKVQVDVRLDEVVLHALEKEPERRYQKASEVKTAVETIAATPGTSAAAAGPAGPPESAPQAGPVRILRFRDAWPWNWEYIQLWLIVPMVVGAVALPLCLQWWGLKALWLLTFVLASLGFAIMYAVVGHRVRQKQATLPHTSGEMAQCLMFRRPFESPGVAVLHEDRLELTPVVGSHITVVLADIVAVKEVRWFNGTRLWFKRGFVMDLANGQRVGVAVAEVFARRWRAKLSRGALPEIPAGGGMDQSPLASQLWRVARRAALVAALSLSLLETLLQLEVGWRESTGELWTMALYSACLAGMVWAAWPLRRRPWTALLRAAAAFALFAAVSLASYFYSWLLRPNVGLYREPGWVAQHPGFQRQLRQQIENNLWQKPAASPTQAVSLGPVTERVLYSVAAQRPIKAEDLDSGREIELSAPVAENSEKEFFHWLAVQGADLLAFAHKQSWELWASPKLAGVPPAMWDQASSEELLRALKSGVVGLGRASLDVKEGFTSYQLNENTVFPQTFAFQTQSGALGVLQLTAFTESPRGVKIRYRLAPSAGRGAEAGGGGSEEVRRKFVRLVVEKDAMTFEGQLTTWETVGALLERVPNRKNTVLECAVTSDQITVQQQNEWFGKCAALAKAHGFEYASFIGIHTLGSKGTAGSETDQDFMAQHRAELGQKALDAARAFVEEHKWKMRSEFGDQGRVVLRATDAAGKQILFEEATMADGTARFTIIAEPGAELSAQRIGAAIWRRLGWVHVSPGVAAQVPPPPVARAEAGTYQVTLTNGITVEVVAVTRNPLMAGLWWKPDGTVLPKPPGEAGEFIPAGMWTRKSVGSNDCAILVRHSGQLTPNLQRSQQYTPRGEFIGHLGVKKVGMADVVRFPAGTKEVAMHVATAADRPWEPVAVFDGSRTRVLIEGIQVLCTHLRHDPDGKCLDVSHNVDRGQYALRMMARFKGVGRREVGLHSGVLSARETQGYVYLDPSEPDLRAGDILEFVLERTPWVSGEIHGIALAPRLGTTLKPPSFGPAIERELGGWPSLDCTVLDLDQGRLLLVPTNTVAASMNNPRPMLNWMVQHGADLTVTTGAGAGLHLDDGVLLPLEGAATFESVAASTVRRQLSSGGGAQDVSISRTEVEAQPVFVYRTREGGMGVLQVLGPSQDPRSLRIRFKAALPLQ